MIVYDKCRLAGSMLELDDLMETTSRMGRKMLDFNLGRDYAVAQGWMVIEGGSLRVTTAGLAAA